MKSKSSLITIDILRAIAALGVFWHHQHVGFLLARYTHLPFLTYTDVLGSTYAVPLFFLISGYCIHLSNMKFVAVRSALPLNEYLKARFLRIYPPYLFAIMFSLAINYITYGDVSDRTDIFVHLFALQGFIVKYFNTLNLVLWTISVELAFYILYPIFYYLRIKYSLQRAMLMVFLVSSISITCFTLGDHLTLPERFCAVNLWFAWCWGAYLADRRLTLRQFIKDPFFIVVNVVTITGFVLIRLVHNHLDILFDQFNVLIWTLPFLFFIGSEDRLRARPRLMIRTFTRIGLSSYSLYLLHEPLILIKNYLVHLLLPQKLQQPAMVAGILVIPALAWLSYKYIEAPFLKRKKKHVVAAA